MENRQEVVREMTWESQVSDTATIQVRDNQGLDQASGSSYLNGVKKKKKINKNEKLNEIKKRKRIG